MCGIAGIFNRDGRAVDAALLVRMTRTLVHRGPDGEGFFCNTAAPPPGTPESTPFLSAPKNGGGNVGLGHRRLSIIDLEGGRQPLCNEDGSLWITFNGEIYNFPELKTELADKGHRFRTHTDTEVILHAYEEWGEEGALTRLRGMFAFALWDGRKRRLWLARDRVGKKPLYYLEEGNRFLFASEIKAILEAPRVSRAVDPEALSDYLSLQYVPAPKSIFKAVRKLPAAHHAVVTAGRFQVRPYWDLPFRPRRDLTEDRAAEELLERLDEAVRMRMISDVPLGAFLSGGVDSSSVVAFMARAAGEPVVTNAVAFDLDRYDESAHARRVAELFHTRHHEFRVTPEAVPVVEKLAFHYDEPFADPSAVPTYYVSHTARRNVTVSLSGDGGDENFAGYSRYRMDRAECRVRGLLPRFLSRPIFTLLGRLYPKADFLPRPLRGKTFLSNVGRDPAEAYAHSMSTLPETEKDLLLHPDTRSALQGYRTAELFRTLYREAPAEDHLGRIQYIDVKTYLCEDILAKVDRASMAVSLEVRCPILDHCFMEFAAGLPPGFKLADTGKYIFKKAMERVLPRDVLHRPKRGFEVPVRDWLRRELHGYAKPRMVEGEATKRFFRRERVVRLWREHERGVRDHSMTLWVVLMFNLWYENYRA